jgi:hypothetical protein
MQITAADIRRHKLENDGMVDLSALGVRKLGISPILDLHPMRSRERNCAIARHILITSPGLKAGLLRGHRADMPAFRRNTAPQNRHQLSRRVIDSHQFHRRTWPRSTCAILNCLRKSTAHFHVIPQTSQ